MSHPSLIIDDIPQYPKSTGFDQLPSIEELNKVISSMALPGAPGDSGLSPIE
jgi:hypothetical protein